MDDEIQEAVNRHNHRVQMNELATQERMSSIFRFIESLDVSQARALQYMLDSIDGQDMTMFYFGYVTSLLSSRGMFHFDEAADSIEGAEGADSDDDTPSESSHSVSDKHFLYSKYNLVDRDGGVFCKNCGQQYVSLEDRMKRDPGASGCQGCRHKEMWG